MRLNAIDKFIASDSLVVYRRNGAVDKGTVALLADYVKSEIGGTPSIYDPATYTEQDDGTYIYFAWSRIDGTGYKAIRHSLDTGGAAGESVGTGTLPADLTVLDYS